MNNIRNHQTNNLSPMKKNIILILPVLVLLLVGIFSITTRLSAESKYRQYKEEGTYTYGVVSDVDKRTVRKKRSGSRKKRTTSTSYYAHGKYSVDDSIYDFSYKSSTQVHEGTRVTIYYDKYKPSDYVIEGCLRGSYFTGVLSLCGALLFGSFVVSELSKSKNASKSNYYNSSSTFGYNQNINSNSATRFYGENVNNGPDMGFYGENPNNTTYADCYVEENFRSKQTDVNYYNNQDVSNGNVGSTDFYKKQ